MQVENQLKELLLGAVAAAGYELWGAELINSGKSTTLRVYIDADKGVDIDDCEKASRQISSVMEVEEIALDRYTLEVSSPGLYRPLFTLEQYKKYIGEEIKLRLKHANELNRKNFSGTLTQADEEGVAVDVDGENYLLDLSDVAHAHLNPDVFKSKSKAK